MSNSLQPHGLQHIRLPCTSPSPGICSNSCPLSQWYHPTISSSVIPFSSYLQSFPASDSFPVSHFFALDGQSIGDRRNRGQQRIRWFDGITDSMDMSLASSGNWWRTGKLTGEAGVLQSMGLQRVGHDWVNWTESFIIHFICKYFIPFSRLSFHLVDGFLCCARTF